MDRRTARFVGAALLVTSVAVGIASAAGAGQVRAAGSLLGVGRDVTVTHCERPFDADAVAYVPDDRFDAGTTVSVSTSDPAGWASGGGPTRVASATLVHVRVPARTADSEYRVEVRAAGLRHRKPAEVIDRLTVSVRCSAR